MISAFGLSRQAKIRHQPAIIVGYKDISCGNVSMKKPLEMNVEDTRGCITKNPHYHLPR
jgi:hypothetical protein